MLQPSTVYCYNRVRYVEVLLYILNALFNSTWCLLFKVFNSMYNMTWFRGGPGSTVRFCRLTRRFKLLGKKEGREGKKEGEGEKRAEYFDSCITAIEFWSVLVAKLLCNWSRKMSGFQCEIAVLDHNIFKCYVHVVWMTLSSILRDKCHYLMFGMNAFTILRVRFFVWTTRCDQSLNRLKSNP